MTDNKERISQERETESIFAGNTGKYAYRTLKKKTDYKKTIDYVLLVVITLFVLAPFYIMLATSFMSKYEANDANFHFWPEQFSLSSYHRILFKPVGGTSVLKGLLNTLLYYLPTSAVGVFMSAMAAFAFARMKFKAKGFMFSVLMGTMMLPNTLSLIISVLMYDKIYWIGTPLPVMVPRLFGTIGIVFFLRQYYMGLPDDLVSAAKVDGLGWFGIFTRIMVPISLPAMAAQFVLNFIGGYNDYLAPVLYLPNEEQYTLQLVLKQLEDPRTQDWPVRMAGCTVAMIPMVILYLFSQKLILMDMSIGSGFKG